MPKLAQQEEVLRELSVLKTLPTEDNEDGVTVRPTYPGSYSISVLCQINPQNDARPYKIVCADRLEIPFDTEDEALDLFFTCLSEDARLIITFHGKTETGWRLEVLQPGTRSAAWQVVGSCAALFVPFWKPRRVETRINPFLRAPKAQ